MRKNIILVFVGVAMLAWSVVLPILGILYVVEHFGGKSPAAGERAGWARSAGKLAGTPL